MIVGVVASSPRKDTMFSAEERVSFLEDSLSGEAGNIEVDLFDTLLVDFAHKWGAKALVKGLRAISDFEYEFQMAQLNRKLAPDLETVYLMASPEYSFLSSSGVKEDSEIRRQGGRPGASSGRQALCRAIGIAAGIAAGKSTKNQEHWRPKWTYWY